MKKLYRINTKLGDKISTGKETAVAMEGTVMTFGQINGRGWEGGDLKNVKIQKIGKLYDIYPVGAVGQIVNKFGKTHVEHLIGHCHNG